MERHKTGPTEFHTTSNFWECSCDETFIKPAYQKYCPDCESFQNGSPDARIEDIMKHIQEDYYKKKLIFSFLKTLQSTGIKQYEHLDMEPNEAVCNAVKDHWDELEEATDMKVS